MPKKLAKEQSRSLGSNVIKLPVSNKKHDKSPDMPHVLSDIQKKVNNSAALNGGFDVLMYKVDKIEETQGKIVETVSSIHQAIYHPDDGLFARINSTKASQTENRIELEKKLVELNSWKEEKEKKFVQEKTADKELEEKIKLQQETVSLLERWKNNANALGKWVLVAFAGGALTLAFRAVYELWLVK